MGIDNIAVRLTFPDTPRHADGAGVVADVAPFFTAVDDFYEDLDAALIGLIRMAYLLAEHRFMEIETEDRPGLPDEARPEIEVTWPSGVHQTVAKWADDTHPDFDAIYAWLIELAEGVTDQSPIYVGPYEEDWRPE